ncbi:MAG: anti-sigma factor [Flavobacteriaceae bacterium]|nr:anti-sigma factor [Flavobacteriaceae bacterium]
MKWNSTYIRDNGLLELYLLDELKEDERVAIEAALDSDSDLKEELMKLEADLEGLAFENEVRPDSSVKTALLETIASKDEVSDDSRVISLTSSRKFRISFYVAASIAALLLLNSIWMYNNLRSSQQQLEVLMSETNDLKIQLANIEAEFSETSKWYAMVNDPDVDKHIMVGNRLSPESVAVAYLNEEAQTVVLKTDKLAPLDSEKTYQMWADVEGEMIDMGVIPKGTDMVTLKYIANAESFNITIEPKGGNDHPTVEALITNVIL